MMATVKAVSALVMSQSVKGAYDGVPLMGGLQQVSPTAEARETRGRCISALEFTACVSALVNQVRPGLGEAGQVQEVVGA